MKQYYRIIKGNERYKVNDLISDEELFEDYESDEDTDWDDVSMVSYLRGRDNNDGAVRYIAMQWGMEVAHVDDIIVCPICGGRVTFGGECKIKDVYNDSEGFGDDAIEQLYICLECGRLITITDPTEEEKKNNYKRYWNVEEEEKSGIDALAELKKKMEEM